MAGTALEVLLVENQAFLCSSEAPWDLAFGLFLLEELEGEVPQTDLAADPAEETPGPVPASEFVSAAECRPSCHPFVSGTSSTAARTAETAPC